MPNTDTSIVGLNAGADLEELSRGRGNKKDTATSRRNQAALRPAPRVTAKTRHLVQNLLAAAAAPAPREEGSSSLVPLVVSPKVAQQMLMCGNTGFYGEILPQLESFKIGRARKVTVASIKAFVAKKLAEALAPAA